MLRQWARHYAKPAIKVSYDVGKFDPERIRKATEKANELLRRINDETNTEHQVQRSANARIDEAQRSGYKSSVVDDDYLDVPTHPQQQAELLKSHRYKTSSERYVYNQDGSVTDRLQRPHKQSRQAPRYPLPSQDERFWSQLEDFAGLLVLKNESPATSLSYKALADSVESINLYHNSHMDPRFTDPNDFSLVCDYYLTRKLHLLENRLHPAFTASSLDQTSVAILGITNKGFAETTDPLQLFVNALKPKFSIICCTLNVPKYPVLTQLSQSNDHIKQNLYTLASLGLTKPQKLENGWIVLKGETN